MASEPAESSEGVRSLPICGGWGREEQVSGHYQMTCCHQVGGGVLLWREAMSDDSGAH